jgi:beta-phosphoglucomutase-like phosphatase (HAD superfamily)
LPRPTRFKERRRLYGGSTNATTSGYESSRTRLFIKYFHQRAVRQTIEWLDRHGIPYWDLCLLRDKAAVGADLYIDDTPSNVEALRAKGLETIVFSNSTNRDVGPPRADTWEEVDELVLEKLAAWKTRPDAEIPPAGH